ncbi:MAG: hypothetical protein GY774_33015 [Planctomycetes bacterium]|nr:hypothetical protein [Planctomycetota bacterium]
MSEVSKRTWLLPQILLVLIAWLFLCWLHWDNDGLWYGDAPRHASNGLFWKDFLLSFSFNPRDYALSYYARYPVITPTLYPPVFYLFEAALFGAFGASPYIAKSFVLGFTLIGALYTTAWSRRWIAKEAGWAGVLFIFLPGVVRWSHAIMLNIPALAMSIGALYHFRRWLESPPKSPLWRHLYVGVSLAVLSILTYLTSCVLVLIAGIWLIVEHRWRLLWNRRTLAVFVASTMALLPWVIVVVKFERNRMAWATGTVNQLTSVPWMYYFECLTYYHKSLSEIFGTHLLFIAAFGLAGGLLVRRWRHETILLLIMSIVCFFFFLYIPAKEARYILLLSMPLAIFCLLGLLSTALCIRKLTRISQRLSRVVTLSVVVVLLIYQAWLGSRVPVMSVKGIKEIVEFIEKEAPDEPVFYGGKWYGNFTFYIQAGDPDYRRRVVLSRKLLYAESSWDKIHEMVSSPQDVVELLQTRGGCRWLVIARRADSPPSKASRHLREAVKGPQFELIKSFPIISTKPSFVERTSIDIYRFLLPIERLDEIDMPLFSLGEGVRSKIKPIQR